MKTVFFKCMLLIQFIFIMNVFSFAQTAPQGYRYQTTVRDAFGLKLGNQTIQLRFSFYSGSASGTLQWQETQMITTDSNGHISVVIGNGITTGAGATSSFSLINWSTNAYYLKVAIDDTGGSSFTDIGSTQLFSVPYAFYSLKTNITNNDSLSKFNDVNLTGLSLNKLLEWNGSFWVPAIDNDSDTVLFSYTSGHSIYSDTASNVFTSSPVDSVLFAYSTDSVLASGNSLNSTTTNSSVHSDTALYAFFSAFSAWERNGNAIVSTAKYIGTNDSNDLIVKTNNAERIRVKANGNVLLGATSNLASLSLSGNDGLFSSGTFGTSAFSTSGAGTKLIWLPSKAAFRAGYINSNQWDTANVGAHSFAVGRNTSTGKGSFSSGDESVTGDYCIAMGRKSKATALGAYPGGNGVAIGDSCSSLTGRSVAIGKGNHIDISVSTVSIGFENKSVGAQSLALGSYLVASGHWSTVIGYHGSSNAKSGSFVYSDASSSTTFNAAVAQEFSVRASGGTIFYSDSANTMGVTLSAGGGSWASVSDKNKKENFLDLNAEEVLVKIEALKIKSWNYKSQNKAIRHIGPMSQDFYNAFGLGENNVSISGIDIDGVILKGIQALNYRVENLSVLNAVDELKNKVNELDDSVELNNRLDIIEEELNKKKILSTSHSPSGKGKNHFK